MEFWCISVRIGFASHTDATQISQIQKMTKNSNRWFAHCHIYLNYRKLHSSIFIINAENEGNST
jgi:hypothetical protein